MGTTPRNKPSFRVVSCTGWSELREHFGRFFALPENERRRFWFRGHGSPDWTLQSTLDRFYSARSSSLIREDNHLQTLREFWQEAMRLGLDAPFPEYESKFFDEQPPPLAVELLARHYGLPSPYLDWTTSPYIATCSAYDSAIARSQNTCSVWALNLSQLDSLKEICEPIDELEPLRSNRRALAQRGVFLKMLQAKPLETLRPKALTRFDIELGDASTALSELKEMTLGLGYLYNDLTGIAQAVATNQQAMQTRIKDLSHDHQ